MSSQNDAVAEVIDAGKAALAQKDYGTVRALLVPIVESGKAPVAGFFLARADFEDGHHIRARSYLAPFLNKFPRHTGGQMLHARMELAEGHVETAETIVRQVRAAHPDFRPAINLLSEIEGQRSAAEARGFIEIIDATYLSARSGSPDEALREAAAGLAGLPHGPAWNNDPVQARIAYFRNAADLETALVNYDPHLIDISCEFDYVTWPKRIQEYVRRKSVIDVGCGFGGYGMGFLIAGAREYVGLDPVMDLDSTRGKNKRIRAWADMGVTPRTIMETLPAIRLFQGTSEDLSFDEKFDTIALHNVTEHLLALEEVLAGLVKLCRPDTTLVYLHHNYYCWNGHHFAPNQPHQLDEDNPDHRLVYDWRHIEIVDDLPDNHYFKTSLNRVRLDEIHEITSRYFEIEEWTEQNSSKATLARLTPEIVDRVRKTVPDMTEREMSVNVVFCRARIKS